MQGDSVLQVTQHSCAVAIQSPLLHAANEDLHGRCLTWARRFELLPDQNAFNKAAKIRVDELARLTYPTALPLTAQLCTDMLLWFFIVDDQFDEREVGASQQRMMRICKNLMQILETGAPRHVTSPLGLALLDLRTRLLQQMSREGFLRFVSNMRLYLGGCLAEVGNRARGRTPTLAEYRDIRRASVGTYPCFDLIALDMRQRLPEALADDPMLAALRDDATDLIAWINDVVSFRKESAFSDPHNIMSVMMAEDGLTEATATERTLRLIKKRRHVFARSASRFLGRFSSAAARQYVTGLEHWIDGCYVWSFRSQRYGKDYLILSQQADYELLHERTTAIH